MVGPTQNAAVAAAKYHLAVAQAISGGRPLSFVDKLKLAFQRPLTYDRALHTPGMIGAVITGAQKATGGANQAHDIMSTADQTGSVEGSPDSGPLSGWSTMRPQGYAPVDITRPDFGAPFSIYPGFSIKSGYMHSFRYDLFETVGGTGVTAAALANEITLLKLRNEMKEMALFADGPALDFGAIAAAGLVSGNASPLAAVADPSVAALATTYNGYWELPFPLRGTRFRAQLNYADPGKAFTVTGQTSAITRTKFTPRASGTPPKTAFNVAIRRLANVTTVDAENILGWAVALDNVTLDSVVTNMSYGEDDISTAQIIQAENQAARLCGPASPSGTGGTLSTPTPKNPVTGNPLYIVEQIGDAPKDLHLSFSSAEAAYLLLLSTDSADHLIQQGG